MFLTNEDIVIKAATLRKDHVGGVLSTTDCGIAAVVRDILVVRLAVKSRGCTVAGCGRIMNC